MFSQCSTLRRSAMRLSSSYGSSVGIIIDGIGPPAGLPAVSVAPAHIWLN